MTSVPATVPFTDEDLKRFHAEYDQMDSDKIDALIARLEAAENVIEAQGHTERCADEFMKNGCICHFQPAIDRWHQAAGK